ncbi:MAG: transcriptional regulator, partial [Flavobacteriia bacterium]
RLHVLEAFEYSEEISPLAYAKLKKQQRQRVRNTKGQEPDKGDMGW